jgi:hypothetical protein
MAAFEAMEQKVRRWSRPGHCRLPFLSRCCILLVRGHGAEGAPLGLPCKLSFTQQVMVALRDRDGRAALRLHPGTSEQPQYWQDCLAALDATKVVGKCCKLAFTGKPLWQA